MCSERVTMYNFKLQIDSYFIKNVNNKKIQLVKRIINERWRLIKNQTKYGWITAYYQCKNFEIVNEKLLENLATKIGNENCKQAIREIKKLSENLHPKEIPLLAELILSEIYTLHLLRKKNPRKDTWKILKYEQCSDKSLTIFTICNTIKP